MSATNITDPKLPHGWNFPIKTNTRDTIAVNHFGYIPTVGSTFETVWEGGGTYAYPTTAVPLTATSLSGATDSGVEITISGLDANWEIQSETIILDASGTKTTTATFIRVNEARISNGQDAVGRINITNGASTYSIILAGFGKSLNSFYSIPVGYTAYMVSGTLSVAKDKDVLSKLMVRQFGGIFVAEGIIGSFGTPYTKDWVVPVQIPAKSDIEIRAKAGATTEIGTNLEIILVKNP